MKIAIMGDLHYPSIHGVQFPDWYGREIKALDEDIINKRDAFFAYYLEQFFSQEVDLYVSLGDLTHFGMKDEFEEVYELIHQYNKPLYLPLGNHDLYSMTRKEIAAYTKMEDNFSIEKEEAIFVFLETARELDYKNHDGWLNDKQLKWLEDILENSGEKMVVIFAHHPIYDTTARSDVHMLSIHPSIDLWSVLKKKKGKGILINGHTHTDSIVSKGNWDFVQASAVLDDQSVRILEIENSEWSITAKDVSNSESIKQGATIGEVLDIFRPFPEGRGTTLNRNKSLKTN